MSKEELVKWVEVVVFLTEDYSINKSVYVPSDLTKDKITDKVNEEFGNEWYFYDINRIKPKQR